MHGEIDFFASDDNFIATWEELQQLDRASLFFGRTITHEVRAFKVELFCELDHLDVSLFDATFNFDLLGLFDGLLATLDLKFEIEGLISENVDIDRFQFNRKDSFVFADATECFKHFIIYKERLTYIILIIIIII